MIRIVHRSIRHLTIFVASFSFAATLAAADIPPTGEGIRLFDGKSLEHFDTFVYGKGFNNDRDRRPLAESVFRVQDGMVRVEGSSLGYFITKQSYSDYYLLVEFKWGQATHEPRKGLTRNSGILYHVAGERKSAEKAKSPFSIWPRAIEFQIMEGGTGDVIMKGAELTVKGERKGGDLITQIDRFNKTDAGREHGWPVGYFAPAGYRDPKNEVEKPHGEWNVLEMVTDGDHINYWVDGTSVMEGTDASLTSGKIAFQSEGAELFYRSIELRPLKKKQGTPR